MDNIALRTITPILLLIGLGFFSRKHNLFKEGDSKVLSNYCYYFAIPAVFFINLSDIRFTLSIMKYVMVAILPDIIMVLLLYVLYKILKFDRKLLLLFIISSVFGSHTFFGIPFINFAFPNGKVEGYEGSIEGIAVLAASAISITCITISIATLEIYKLGNIDIMKESGLILKKLVLNPLIISILAGILISVSGIKIPDPIAKPIRMLGGTANTLAIFLLGILLYGRKYERLGFALKLSLFRMAVMPLLALVITYMFGVSDIRGSILVLMHGMPLAMTMIILSERYNFYEDTIPSLIMICSLGSTLYLNIWMLILGIR